MDLTYPPEAEQFRKEVRAWLEQNLPHGWFDEGFEMSPDERRRFNEEWTDKLREGGWICASWPKEYGGKGLSVIENVVLNEEFAAAKAPMRADFFGDTLVGPTILQWGTEEQKRQFLPGIIRGEISWCQGFSEPDSGSDLASLTSTAVLDGDEWVVNGQKVWTTQAQHADLCFFLARTDPGAPKHKGISYLLVPMRQPGIEVRPIVQPDGSAEFNEVFFTDARCPKDNVVGGVNNGWKVANTTLGFERGASATTSHRRFERELETIVDKARENGRIDDPLIRQRLVRQWAKIQIMRINGLRSLTEALRKEVADAAGTKLAPNMDVIALGATNKMFWSETHRDTMELAMDILGMEGQVLTGSSDEEFVPGVGRRSAARDYPVSPLQASFFFSRSETIWGGTAEIQRNIVGERFLGLPREPRPEGAKPKA
ncbi:MAG: acyl-CoA dehydrogenase family protein [Actinobacteria bacterium]|nr:acyl-CoA dehydrogenase family protein [Actinomycetota bacterium]